MNRQLLLGTEELVAVSASNPFRIVTGAIRVRGVDSGVVDSAGPHGVISFGQVQLYWYLVV